MKKLTLISIIIMILFSFSTLAIDSGESSTIYTIEKCEGPIRIHLVPDKAIKDNEYNFTSFTQTKTNWWQGTCSKSPYNIILNTKSMTDNNYYIIMEYYLPFKPGEPKLFKSENAITKIIGYIKVDPSKERDIQKQQITSNLGIIIIVILGVISLVGLVIYLLYRFIFSKEEEEIYLNKAEDEDIKEYLKRL